MTGRRKISHVCKLIIKTKIKGLNFHGHSLASNSIMFSNQDYCPMVESQVPAIEKAGLEIIRELEPWLGHYLLCILRNIT